MSTSGSGARPVTPEELLRPNRPVPLPGADEALMALPQLVNGRVQAWRGLKDLPEGDGRTVIDVPGYGDTGWSFVEATLKSKNYNVEGPGFDRNVGDPYANQAALNQKLVEVTDRDGEPATLVGHSFGGVLVRGALFAHPERVEHAARVASPNGLAGAYPVLGDALMLTMGRHRESYARMINTNTRAELDPRVPLTVYVVEGDAILPVEAQIDPATHANHRALPGTHAAAMHGWPFTKDLAEEVLDKERRGP